MFVSQFAGFFELFFLFLHSAMSYLCLAFVSSCLVLLLPCVVSWLCERFKAGNEYSSLDSNHSLAGYASGDSGYFHRDSSRYNICEFSMSHDPETWVYSFNEDLTALEDFVTINLQTRKVYFGTNQPAFFTNTDYWLSTKLASIVLTVCAGCGSISRSVCPCAWALDSGSVWSLPTIANANERARQGETHQKCQVPINQPHQYYRGVSGAMCFLDFFDLKCCISSWNGFWRELYSVPFLMVSCASNSQLQEEEKDFPDHENAPKAKGGGDDSVNALFERVHRFYDLFGKSEQDIINEMIISAAKVLAGFFVPLLFVTASSYLTLPYLILSCVVLLYYIILHCFFPPYLILS